MADKRNPAITLCRVCSMIMIVLCHTIRYYTFIPGHHFLGQILNVGVFSFLAISGYLYGDRTITDFRRWFLKRFLVVAFPVILFSGIVILIDCFAGNRYNWFTILLYLTNLQGLFFLFPRVGLPFTEIEILGPLWFATVIMLCYCLLPFFQYWRSSIHKHKTVFLLCTAAATLIVYVFAMNYCVPFVYGVTFMLGYFLGAEKVEQKISPFRYTAITTIMFLFQIGRLLLNAVMDGTLRYQTYASISHMILGLWILLTFLILGHMVPNLLQKLSRSKLIVFADGISFYVYLIHYCFCRGRLNIYEYTQNLLLATVVFFVLTIVCAMGLKWIIEKIQNLGGQLK